MKTKRRSDRLRHTHGKSTEGAWWGWGIVGGILGVIVFFVFFKKPPTGPFSDFGKPTLVFTCGYIVFAVISKVFSLLSNKQESDDN